jgi:predicted RND superfamily exporter protein
MKSLFLKPSVQHPRIVMTIIALLTVAAIVPMLKIVDRIDTDPENMLPDDEPVRVEHTAIKEAFGLNDFLVVGIVHDETVFTPAILERAYEITEALYDMQPEYDDDGNITEGGVIVDDVLAPSEVDDILPEPGGGIRVQTLMASPPETQEEAETILAQIEQNPILRGKLASEDGKALAIFVPLTSKDVAADVDAQIQEIIAGFEEDLGEEYHVAGQPVAQDTFGAAMFEQMAVSAPAAFLLIFLLMLFFFRSPRIVAAPMIIAMISVIWTMGLLIATGNTVHIMSSMIPIFLIPIAVLNSIHILSSIHAKFHSRGGDLDRTLEDTVGELFLPMAFTSLTTVVGFGALVATPIPPVQVFGIFVAFGVFSAWLLSLVFIPAYVKLMPIEVIQGFGKAHEGGGAPESHLHAIYRFSTRFRVPVIATLVVIIGVSIFGVTQIVVNDNPVNWFKEDHRLRVADRVMNEHLSGTYLAYLELSGEEENAFLEPEWMSWAERLQDHLLEQENVGAASSVVDVLKKVQYELLSREEGSYALGDNRQKLAQYLFLYEMSGGSPDDLFKFITPNRDAINIWVQMHKGDNQQVAAVVDGAQDWIGQNPPPQGLEVDWGGLSYINVKWQELMVSGMGKALAGSYVTVLIMMVLLFRSVRLGLLAMVPLTATILITYGYVGLSGRFYDMPVAVLSSLSLGLSVDFAIHFIQRTRDLHARHGRDFQRTMQAFFHEPAQALARNVVVIALGFVPMFFASLVPYVTVGAFFFGIMLISGGATFLILPAVLSFFPRDVISKPSAATNDGPEPDLSAAIRR